MKKILFATTALVATAGVAAADVAITGFAEMGVAGGSEVDSQFHTDIDVFFRMSGEADNGLSFTAAVDLDENGAFGAATQGGETIAIAYGGVTVTMGDTDGAYDAALSEVGFGGAIADDHTGHAGYSGQGGIGSSDDIVAVLENVVAGANGLDGFYDGQVARVDYAAGMFSVHASLELADDRDLGGVPGVSAGAVMGLGAVYNADGLRIGVGHQSVKVSDDFGGDFSASFTGVSLQYAMGDITVGTNYSMGKHDVFGDDVSSTHMGVGAQYTMNALTLGVNYGASSVEIDGGDDFSNSGWGVSANYDFGGGLVAQFGYGSSNVDELIGDDFNTWSLGLAMSF
jgi:outer membrane protein OmpU